MNIRSKLLFLTLLLLPFWAHSADLQTALQEELDSYTQALNTTEGSELADLANKITSSGLSDERLFDQVQDLLNRKHQENMTVASKDKIVIHQIVTLLRTLASSGNTKYYATLYNITHESENRAIRNRAKHVQSKITFYGARNAIMQNMDTHKENQSLNTTRILNLLNDPNLIMNRFAAEEIFRAGIADTVLQDFIYERFAKEVRQPRGKLHVDTLAWYAKVLGLVNKEKYSAPLSKLQDDKSIEKKIRKHIKSILRR